MDITVQELKTRLDKNETFIFIDVREMHEYEEFNLGAKLIPLGSIMEAVSEYEPFKNEEIVVHCRSGQRSAMAQQLFHAGGVHQCAQSHGRGVGVAKGAWQIRVSQTKNQAYFRSNFPQRVITSCRNPKKLIIN